MPGDQPRQQRDVRLVQRVRDAVREHRVDARPDREDLAGADVARGGVALLRGAHVAADLAPRRGRTCRAGHAPRVAAWRARAGRGYGAKNGVET